MNYNAKGLFDSTYTSYAVIMAAVIIIVACFILIRVKVGGYAALSTKILATLSILVAAMYGIMGNKYRASFLFIVLGLICGLIGDILLDLKVIDREHDSYYTNSGMAAFAFGHFMYLFAIIGLCIRVNMLVPSLISVCIAAIVSSLIMFVLKKPLKLDFGKFFWQSYIYSFILIFMTAFSIYLAFLVPKMWIFAVGLGLFLLSDLVLSTQYFGGKLDNKLLIIVNHALYYLGQIGICTVLFFM